MKSLKILSLIVVLLFALTNCGEESLDIDTDTSIPVRVEAVKLKPMQEYVSATSTVFAAQEALLKIEQTGNYQLQKNPRTGTLFSMGDRVLKGEILVKIENQEFINQVAIDSKKLNYDVSEREFEKQKGIYDKGGITLRELTDAERAFIDAKYSYDNAKLSLEKLKIEAPFTGILVDIPYYSPNQWVEANAEIARMMDYSRLYADVTLPGKEMGRISRGQSVIVRSYGSSAQTVAAKVTQVSPALDPESRMFKTRVEIPNPQVALKPGTFIAVDIVVGEKDAAIVIPKDIILDRRGNKIVYTVERGIAMERRLQTGMSNRDEIEVLDGLRVDDRLIVEGFETLRNRSRVKILN